jgi:hypothetical protein
VRDFYSAMPTKRIHPAIEDMLRSAARSCAQQFSEILTNTVAAAADDALERVEEKAGEVLGRIRKARGVAQKRSRRGRR